MHPRIAAINEEIVKLKDEKIKLVRELGLCSNCETNQGTLDMLIRPPMKVCETCLEFLSKRWNNK